MITDNQWIDIYCLTRMITRLDVIKQLIPEQTGRDEQRRCKLIKMCQDWELNLTKRIDKITGSAVGND